MLIRQHERFVEELNVQMSFKQPTTSSGSVMTLPAATMDLRDWMADQRKFLSVQYDDWMQVIGDFRDSLAESGPKLVKLVDAITTQIESLLPELISPSDPDRVPSPIASFLREGDGPQRCLQSDCSTRIDSLLQQLVPRRAAHPRSNSFIQNPAMGLYGRISCDTLHTSRSGVGYRSSDHRGVA